MEPRAGKGRQSVGKHGRMRNKLCAHTGSHVGEYDQGIQYDFGNNLGRGTQTGSLLVGQAQQVFVGAKLVRRLENAMKKAVFNT